MWSIGRNRHTLYHKVTPDGSNTFHLSKWSEIGYFREKKIGKDIKMGFYEDGLISLFYLLSRYCIKLLNRETMSESSKSTALFPQDQNDSWYHFMGPSQCAKRRSRRLVDLLASFGESSRQTNTISRASNLLLINCDFLSPIENRITR